MARTILASVFPGISGSDRRLHLKAILLTSTLLVAVPVLAAAQELPSGGSVASGNVSIGAPSAGSLLIRQNSDRAVVNWDSFSIGSGGSVDIRQPGSTSAILNRVTGAATSEIHGQLTANGQVYIVNPNGILIGEDGQVRTGGGFVASTLDVADEDFRRGRLTFRGDGSSAGVTNLGSISVGRGGYAALIGGRVNNAGTIVAPLGRIGFGAGERVTLDLSGDGFLQVALPSEHDGNDSALIQNSGRVSADGGRIEMKAATARDAARNAINLSGVAEARSVSMQNGAIVLGGGNGGTVRVSGRVSTAAPRQVASDTGLASSERPPRQTGGTIDITGAQIMLLGALLDARGDGGGGRIRVGGDFAGEGRLPHADSVTADANTRIRADALTEGDGGRIVLWSDRRTAVDAEMSARGGSEGGNGGFVEVSSADQVRYTGRTDLRAPKGEWGSLLIDPRNIIIEGDIYDTVSVEEIEDGLARGNFILDTASPDTGADGDIVISADITWTADTTLQLRADDVIQISGTISGVNGGMDLDAATSISVLSGGTISVSTLTMVADTITIGGTVIETGSGGSVTADLFTMDGGSWTQNGPTLSTFAADDFRVNFGSTFLRVLGGTGTQANPYLLADVYGLQGMDSQAFLSRHFALANDIDATGTTGWREVGEGIDGFDSIGDLESSFTGSLDGRGHTIDGLYAGLDNYVSGLFSWTEDAAIRNLTLTNVD
ncbi:filamentous hemagglutinin N-terminal domain-containing protein, partial [uncultured Paracoccus sp.]|uniref:two-partner secretion domain-containing protein n=1 Tax=uncultured Paracoccus sp. TaxID=189685 RepID=UPI00262401AA